MSIQRRPQDFCEEEYDLVVVGGGIHGAVLLLQASLAGLRTILLERDDFGGGTSWNSLRILHGGLRYLQTADLPRFRQSVVERRWFFRTFPGLVRPLPCLMPLYGRGLQRPLVLSAALTVNDLLSWDRNRRVDEELHLERGTVLDPAATRERFPGARDEGLDGGALWYDGVMTNPSRILMETLRWAARAGGRALNRMEARKISGSRGAVEGVVAEDHVTGEERFFRSDRVALTVGPNPALVGELTGETPADAGVRDTLLPPSLAFNLVLRKELPAETAVAVSPPAPGSHLYFLHSRGDLTLAGTGHVAWERDQREVRPAERHVRTMLSDLNEAVAGWELMRSDVAQVLAGVLPARERGSSELARREQVLDHGRAGGPKGLYSVVGIKYTTARSVAEQALRAMGARPSSSGASVPRPPRREILSLDRFLRLASREPGAAKSFLRGIRDEEAVCEAEDLVYRRMDWGLDPERAREAETAVGEMLIDVADRRR